MRELWGTRVLGVGLAAALSALTIALWLTGQLGLYINPDSSWFAVSMAFVALAGCAASFALPRSAGADHGHDHDHDHDHDHGHEPAAARASRPSEVARQRGARTAAAIGGIVATGIVAVVLVTPPATLSAELAMQRDTGTAPLFQGSDTIALASTGDTASFGLGEWASVFATATNPEAFDGTEVTLTGFVTPADSGFSLTRLIITHCVIDAQPANVAVAADPQVDTPQLDTGQWVTVTGTIRDDGGTLAVHPTRIEAVDQPKDPYEY